MATTTETPAQGVENSKPVNDTALSADGTKTDNPFGGQREGANPFSANGGDEKATGLAPASPPLKDDRRLSSDEWDASKTPPSRFQQRKGSVYATPGSRDGHVDRNKERDAKFHELHDKKHGKKERRASKTEKE